MQNGSSHAPLARPDLRDLLLADGADAFQIVARIEPRKVLVIVNMTAGLKAGCVLKRCCVEMDFVWVFVRLIGNGCSAIAAEMSAHIFSADEHRWDLSGPLPTAVSHSKIGRGWRGSIQAA